LKEWKAPEKEAQKMTRDGAVSVNLVTGETTYPSDRTPEQDHSASGDTAGAAGKVVDRVELHREQAAAKKKRRKQRRTYREGEAAAGRPSSRLQFSEADQAKPELQGAIRKSDKAADRLDAAKTAVPSKLPSPQHANPLSRPIQEAGAAIHGKVREVEQENSGVQSGHLGERSFEKAVGYGNRRVQNWRAERKLKPWRDAAKAEQAAVKANADFYYRKAVAENPQLASNPISRLWQKRKLQKQYAAAYRAAGKTASVVLHLAARVTPFDACPEFFPDVLALVNDKEVSDHHAILPTLELEKANVPGLPVGERNILLLVCCKLLCAAAEPFVYEAVTATFDCGGHTFTAKGKQVLSQGWRAIQEVFRSSLKEKPEDEDAEGVLPALTEGQVFEPVSASVTEHFTSPPKPYTEDTLLSAMENAGKEDMPDEAERKGLGTPATRAAIIEKLVSGGFVERKGKNLIPTKAGVNLVTVLPELLTSPKLTADWEQRLNEVAKGQASPEDFMDGIEAMAAELVRKYSHISEDGQKLFQPEKETVGLCPRCGKPVYEGKKNFACSDRACQFVMWKNDRFWTSRRKEMTRKMAADLLKKGHTSVKGMWSEKKGSTYDAVVILDDTGGKYVNFKLEFPKRKDGVHGKK
jgi:hypothetical protein